MTALLSGFFESDSVWLRIWFDDGTVNGEQEVGDVRLTSVAYAFHAASADHALTATDSETVGGMTAASLDDTQAIASAIENHNGETTAHANIQLNATNNITSGMLDAQFIDDEIARAADVSMTISNNIADHDSDPSTHADIVIDGSQIAAGAITTDKFSSNAEVPTATQALGFQGYIHGGTISNSADDVTNDLTITAGAFRSDDNTHNIEVPEMTKRIDAAWAPGDAAGGWDNGVSLPDTSTLIAVWAIGDSSGVNPGDYLFSTSLTDPTLPSGYDSKRFIGGRPWDGFAWYLFQSQGSGADRWTYLAQQTQIFLNNTTVTSARIPVDLSKLVPMGFCRLANIAVRMNGSTGDSHQLIAFLPDEQGTGDHNFLDYVMIGGLTTQRATTAQVFLDELARFEYLHVRSNVIGYLRAYWENL